MFLLISRSLVVAFQHFSCFVPVTVGEELVVYKIFLNKEITDGGKTPGEGGGYSSQTTMRITAAL